MWILEMEISREICDIWCNLATVLGVGWQGRGRDKEDICFLDNGKHVVQCTEPERSKERRAGSLGSWLIQLWINIIWNAGEISKWVCGSWLKCGLGAWERSEARHTEFCVFLRHTELDVLIHVYWKFIRCINFVIDWMCPPNFICWSPRPQCDVITLGK